MLRKSFVVENKSGLHCRAAAVLVNAVSGYDAEVKLLCGDSSADCRSILDILALGCVQGARVEIQIKGPQAEVVMNVIVKVFAEKFGEKQ
jgi:phosphotransferase system HPr (HPr) family protein